jgi:hypothetical protein
MPRVKAIEARCQFRMWSGVQLSSRTRLASRSGHCGRNRSRSSPFSIETVCGCSLGKMEEKALDQTLSSRSGSMPLFMPTSEIRRPSNGALKFTRTAAESSDSEIRTGIG